MLNKQVDTPENAKSTTNNCPSQDVDLVGITPLLCLTAVKTPAELLVPCSKKKSYAGACKQKACSYWEVRCVSCRQITSICGISCHKVCHLPVSCRPLTFRVTTVSMNRSAILFNIRFLLLTRQGTLHFAFLSPIQNSVLFPEHSS